MQVTESKSDGLIRVYDITIPGATVEEKVTSKLEEARGTVEIKGFRKGKVPLKLLRQRFGQSLLGETLQEVVDTSVRDLISDKDHRPAMTPDVKMTNEDFNEGDDVSLTVAYELLPDVPEVDFAAIELEKLVVEVEDVAVEEALTRLAADAVDYETADKAAEEKDQVVIDFVGKMDGEPFEGGTAEEFPLVLGSGQFVPGFEDQLHGVKAGDERTVELTMPEDYGNDGLAGKDVVFEVTVREVKAPQAAEMNDAFAERFGMDSLDALKDDIRTRVGAEFEQASRAHLKRKLLDDLDGRVEFELPPTMLEIEAKQVAHQLWHEEHPEVEGHDHEEIEPTEEHEKIARRRVMLGLLLAHVGSANEISVTEEELRAVMIQQARQYPGQERQFLEWVQGNQQAINEMQAPIFEDKVVDHILEHATISEKAVTKEDLEKALEDLESDTV